MTEHVLAVASEHAPWRPETPWWVTGIGAIVLVGIGIFALAAPASAGNIILQLIALALLVQCVLNIASGLRRARQGVDPYVMLQAGVGATIGLLVLFRGFLVPTLDVSSARVILALGLIFYVVIEAAGSIIMRPEGVSQLNRAVNGLLLIVLAIMLLTSSDDNALDRLSALGWIMIVGGVLLAIMAYFAYRRANPDSPQAAAA
jgi:uncharacterized membrane protein HdeD (DUF308 family)